MTTPSEKEIDYFLHEQIRLWNAGDREGFTALNQKYAPNALTVEYVGLPMVDGWTALNHMWDTYNGKVRVDIDTILVNGNEGACHYVNNFKETGVANPSLELYRFEDGELHIRYFHQPESLLD